MFSLRLLRLRFLLRRLRHLQRFLLSHLCLLLNLFLLRQLRLL